MGRRQGHRFPPREAPQEAPRVQALRGLRAAAASRSQRLGRASQPFRLRRLPRCIVLRSRQHSIQALSARAMLENQEGACIE
eukprot:7451625-Pyramimonas_sp.AAC.1